MHVMQVMAGARTGGAETFFERLVAALEVTGLTQTVVIRHDDARRRRLEDAGLSPIECGFGGLLDVMTPLKLKSLLANGKPDIALTWMNRASVALPRSSAIHCARLGGYYNLKYYRKCRHLIGNTPGIVDYLKAQGWPADRTHYLPNFPPNYDEDKPGTPIARSQWQTPEDVPLILALGRLHENKGHDVLIRALANVPSAHAWIAGEGPLEGDLGSLADEMGLADRVHFLGWQTNVTDLMATADILAFPSRFEPLGNVILEAWACRIPIVASRSDGADFLIENDVNGLLVPAEDADAFASKLNAVLADKAGAASLVTAGRTKYERDFSKKSVVEQYLKFFEQVLQAG